MRNTIILAFSFLNLSIAFSQTTVSDVLKIDTVFYQNELGKDCFKTTFKEIGYDLMYTGWTKMEYWQNRVDDEDYLMCLRELIGSTFDKSDAFFADSVLWKKDDLIRRKIINQGCNATNKVYSKIEVFYQYVDNKISKTDTIITEWMLFMGNHDITLIKEKEEPRKYPLPSQNDIFDYSPIHQPFEKTFIVKNEYGEKVSLKPTTNLKNLKIILEKTTLEPLESQEVKVIGFLDSAALKGVIKLLDTSNNETFYETDLRLEGYHIHMKDFYSTKSDAEKIAVYQISRKEPLRIATLSNHHLTNIYKNDKLLVYLTTGSIIQTVHFRVLKNGIYLLEAIDLRTDEKTYFRIEIVD